MSDTTNLEAMWLSRHEEWCGFVEGFVSSLKSADGVPLRPTKFVRPWKPLSHCVGERPLKILMCSPHPDDEALVGALPLRALQEANANVVNCAVTLGSRTDCRLQRLEELKASCNVLGFEHLLLGYPGSLGLDNVKAGIAEDDPHGWRSKVALMKSVLEEAMPDVVVMPHEEDFNRTHRGTHQLAMEAAIEYSRGTKGRRLLLFRSEYWHPMKDPNLMIGVSVTDEATLVMAVAEHRGEVERNPYHLRHPARMIDQVRRGSEVVKGEGSAAESFPFAELYKVTLLINGTEKTSSRWSVIAPDTSLRIGDLYALFE